MQQAIDPAWWLSSVADLRWKGVEHGGPYELKGVDFAQKYINLFTKQAMKKADQEKDNHLFFMQFLMNALILPPSEYFKSGCPEHDSERQWFRRRNGIKSSASCTRIRNCSSKN